MKTTAIIALAIFCVTNFSAKALDPSREYSVKPEEFSMNYKTERIPTDDGAELNAWFFPAPKTSYKLVILSDDGNGNMSDLLEVVSHFLSMDYNVITYDYRGYGASSDFEINKQFYIYAQFEKDLNSVLEYAKKNHSNMPKLTLYGQGIGAGLSISVGSGKKVDYIIADSPYTTFAGIQQKIKATQGVDVKLPLGYNKVDMEPEYALENKGATLKGILYIVGSADALVTDKDLKEVIKLKKDISSVYVVKDANSSTTFSSNKEKYFTTIKEFVK